MSEVPWRDGKWSTAPLASQEHEGDLLVTAVEGSDAWRHTAYGFVHDTEHALLAPLAQDHAVEVEFTAEFDAEFDQAGVFLKASEELWIKTGLELADGVTQLGAVVTAQNSDWSMAPVPDWAGRRVTVRASRAGDAVVIRARIETEPFRLVRVTPFPADAKVWAGPFCCAPTRSGLQVRFHAWRITDSDAFLH